MTKRSTTWTGHPEQARGNRGRRTDKVSVKKPQPPPVNRPTAVRTWWLVDVRETRTLKVLAVGPKHARDIAVVSISDLYPFGSPLVKSVAHTVQADEGRRTRDRI